MPAAPRPTACWLHGLRRAGFTANASVLEVAQGFIVRPRATPIRRSMRHCRVRAAWLWIRSSNHHAACYLTHSSIEADQAVAAAVVFQRALIWQASTSMSRRDI